MTFFLHFLMKTTRGVLEDILKVVFLFYADNGKYPRNINMTV
jgi:hypothetical protein